MFLLLFKIVAFSLTLSPGNKPPKLSKNPSSVLSGHNDHRIVMSLSLLLTLTGGTIDDAQAVRKSYPGFFDDIKTLGIATEQLS